MSVHVHVYTKLTNFLSDPREKRRGAPESGKTPNKMAKKDGKGPKKYMYRI